MGSNPMTSAIILLVSKQHISNQREVYVEKTHTTSDRVSMLPKAELQFGFFSVPED